jgi:hypothetical protein
MATTVYLLCTLTSGLCALLLLREHRRTRTRLLLWSGLSFVVLAVSNALVFADDIVLPDADLSLVRAITWCVAGVLMLYGLIWDAD